MPTTRCLVPIVLALLATPTAAQTLDDFENGVNPQGWSGLVSSGGNPGWCLEMYSPNLFPPFGVSAGVVPSTLTVPYVGSWRGAQVTELKFDVYNDYGATDGQVQLWDPASGNGAIFEFYNLPLGWSVLSLPIPAPGQPAPGWTTYFNTPGYTWEDLLNHVSVVDIGFFYWSGFGNTATTRIDNIELVHATGFHLYASDLNPAGTPSTVTALNGTPGGLVGFGASLGLGTATVNCAGATLGSGLASPRILGIVSTDTYGHAHVSATPRAGAAGTSVRVQALDLQSCTLSNVLTVTLP